MYYMVGLVLFIRFMVGHVLCAIMALHVRVQAVTPTRLKPFLSRLWMRTAPSKRIARAREHAIAKRTRAPCPLLILAPHTCLLCAMCPRHVHCVRARICTEQLLHRTMREALTVQTYCLITRISRNAYASMPSLSPSPPTPLACTAPVAPG